MDCYPGYGIAIFRNRFSPTALRAMFIVVMLLTSACASVPPSLEPATHLDQPSTQADIQARASNEKFHVAPTPPAEATYSLDVEKVDVQQLLLALADEAEKKISVFGQLSGPVSLIVKKLPLEKILGQIAAQASFRYELITDTLLIMPDKAYLETYAVDYLNISRSSRSQVKMATQIGTIGGEKNLPSMGSNNSETEIANESVNQFWVSLVSNLRQLLNMSTSIETSAVKPDGTKLLVNQETGLVSVYAKQAEHKTVEAYIKKVSESASRQVLIEATIIEVSLNEKFQRGVDWNLISKSGRTETSQNTINSNLTAPPFFTLNYTDALSQFGDLQLTLKLMQQFGDVKVLSSPKITAMNNQSAVLKVVDNRVYFTTKVEQSSTETKETAKYQTELHTVPVGFVMSVTPYISKSGDIVLNVRPTISRILGFVADPNPILATQQVKSLIPEIQVREVEVMLTVSSGQTAIIGGLMQDKNSTYSNGVPWLSNLPLLGRLFEYEERVVDKTELIVFLQPKVIYKTSPN